MANEFLIRKWKACFQANDINKEHVITMEDAELFTDRFAAHYKFDDKQTSELKKKFRYFWREFFLKGKDKITEKMHIDNLREEFNADRVMFRENIKNLLNKLADIFDVNKDRYLSGQEMEALLEAWGISTLDEVFIKMYPKRKPGYIDLNDYRDTWIEFYCNDDESDISKEIPPTYGLRML